MKRISVILALLVSAVFSYAQVSHNTTLIGQLDFGPCSSTSFLLPVNDVWGYTDGMGNEYAIVGRCDGVSVVKVETNGLQEIDFFPGPSSTWRDIKTHDHYAYVTHDGVSAGIPIGLTIIDLADLPNSTRLVGNFTNIFQTAHNLFISDGFAYISGSNSAGGADILDLSNPEAPVKVGEWNQNYFHDIFVRNDTLYGSAGGNSSLLVLDVTNKTSPQIAGQIIFPSTGYSHNSWTTEDGKYVMTTEETNDVTVKMWDIRDLANPVLVDEYLAGPGKIAHNTHIKGDYAYISHYSDGLRILDISDPTHMVEVAYYDTYQGSGMSYDGNWGAFPFTASGYIYASDRESGLFVVEFNGRRASRLRGRVLDADTGNPISGALLQVDGITQTEMSEPDGSYKLGFPDPGTFALNVSHFLYETADVSVNTVEGGNQVMDIMMNLRTQGTVTGLVTDEGGTGLANVQVVFPASQLDSVVTDQNGNFTLSAPSGTYSYVTGKWGYRTNYGEISVVGNQTSNIHIALEDGYHDDFEVDLGWQIDDPLGNFVGPWQRVDPGELGFGLPFNPDADITADPGKLAYFGRALNSVLILTTPAMDLTGFTAPILHYHVFWYPRGAADLHVVQISTDDGNKWANLKEYSDLESTNGWQEETVTIPDFQKSSQTRIRFLSAETANQASSFAFVDEFAIIENVTHISDNNSDVPVTYSLEQNYPNPFNAGTVIRYALPEQADISLNIYDLLGRKIRSLVKGVRPVGHYDVKWDGKDDFGKTVSSGVYFYRLQSAGFSQSNKMLLVQ